MALVLLGSLLLLMTSQARATCPDRDAMSNLNTTRVLGLWHVIREPNRNLPGTENIKCTHNLLKAGDNGGIKTLYMFYNTTLGAYQTRRSSLRKETAGSANGKFVGDFGDSGSSYKYYFLGTDYSNYLVTWLCRSTSDGSNIDIGLMLSRQRTLGSEHQQAANALLPAGDYADANQSDCVEHDHEGHGAHGHSHHHH